MSRHRHATHHRDRSWPPVPLPLGTPAIDDHTHLASVVPFSREMARQATERNMPAVPVYDVDHLLAIAASVGVTQIIDVGCEYPNLSVALEMAKTHPRQVYTALAIHPNEAVLHGHHGVPGPDGLPVHYEWWHDVSYRDAFDKMAQLVVDNPGVVVAVGETGLDLFRTGGAGLGLQLCAFRDHIALAKEIGLPMQIHDRDAHRQVVETLLEDGAPEGTVFHSFSAGPDLARLANKHGWYLSFSGAVSFKGNDSIRQALSIADKRHILVETDAPYLTPMPYRGRTNSPYMIPYTLAAMADVLGMETDGVARLTADNARRLYRI
ncbi:MAG: TatD family hydrolase [Aeriscardovia sp.]|nr:TatD family hydrolase [Aeriscardovia sp.]